MMNKVFFENHGNRIAGVLHTPSNKTDKIVVMAHGFVSDKVSRADFEKQGYVIKTRRGREFKIEKEYFEERKAVNQKELLSRVKCPVLIVHGNEDDSVPLSHSEKAMNYLSSNSELKIIQGADHHLEIIHGIDKMALDWFKRYLK